MKPPTLTAPQRRVRISRFRTVFWRTLLTVFFLVITLGTAAFLFPQQFLTIDSGDVKADALIVLGGGDGRAERAAELYHQGAAPAVVVTGFGDCNSNVATLRRMGVPAESILFESKALSTMENVRYSLPMLQKLNVHQAIIVTSWYHSRRALACYEHVIPGIKFYSRPSYFQFEPKNQNRQGFNEHVNIEYIKLAYYWFKHGVWPF